MAGKKSYRFTGVVAEIKGNLLHTAIFLPDEIVSSFPKGRWRAKGTLNDIPFDLAPQPKNGQRYFAVSAGLRKTLKVKKGDKVAVVFHLVDPELLELPEEMEAVLSQDAEALRRWEALTTGYQRSLIHYITSVKNVDSRIKRALEIVGKMKANIIPRTPPKKKKAGA